MSQVLRHSIQDRDNESLPVTDKNTEQQVETEFQNVLRILVDPQLQPLRSRIQILYGSFIDHIELERGNHNKCLAYRKDKENLLSQINNCNKMIDDQNNLADSYKKDLEKREADTEQLKRKEQDVRDTVAKYQNQLAELERQAIKCRDDLELKHETEENQLKKVVEEHKKVKDELSTKLMSLRAQQDITMTETAELQKVNRNFMQRIRQLTEEILDIQSRQSSEKLNKQRRKEELNACKQKKDEFKIKKIELEEKIARLQADIIESAQRLKKQKKDKDEQMRIRVNLNKRKEMLEREHNRRIEELEKQQMIALEKQEELRKLDQELSEANESLKKQQEQRVYSTKRVNDILTETQEVFRRKEEKMAQYELQKQSLQAFKQQRQENRNKILEKLAKRMQSQKKYKGEKNEQHLASETIIELLNKHKKVTNQVTSYQAEYDKLTKVKDQLIRQQEKYGIQASGAHLKYYHTIEQLKIKNVQIQNLQRDNEQVESKCKHQQNLYETVRSDRNLYCKQFLKSKEEISELSSKYSRMTSEVSQLREQIKAKDQQVLEHDKEFRKIETENTKIEADQERAEAKTHSTEEVIRNQESHIANLKKIIQEAKGQKVRQQKDYDMVVNQRDILGTQLIKKNQELAILYEKIKLLNSNITKVQLHENKLQRQFKEKEKEIAQLRNEHDATEKQIRSINDLKSQVSFKQKELLSQKTKVRALEDQLSNPMNVHRWRKLEATDQQNYERILKIQTLQRRLISKTEEVQAKQNIIREKQKLFLELKNILSRQPGSEIHEQLQTYKEALKKKVGQMKEMKNELQMSHSQVNSLTYEVNRLKGEMGNMKKQYFELRAASEKEVMQQRDLAKEAINMNMENNLAAGLGLSLMGFPQPQAP